MRPLPSPSNLTPFNPQPQNHRPLPLTPFAFQEQNLRSLVGMPLAEVDVAKLRAAIQTARTANVGAAELQTAEARLHEVESKRTAALEGVNTLSSPPLTQVDQAKLGSAIDEAQEVGVPFAKLEAASARLSQVKTLAASLLQLLEEEKLTDKLVPLMMKHKVHTAEELAGWQEGSLVRLMGLSNTEAATLKAAAITEQQLSQGRSFAVSILQHLEDAGHTQYLICTTAVSPDGRRKEFRNQHRVTEFVELHKKIAPTLMPRLPAAFPFSPQTPRFLQTNAFLNARMALLDIYLRQAVVAAQGDLPPELSAFLGLPAGGVAASSSLHNAVVDHAATQYTEGAINQPGVWPHFISYTQRNGKSALLASEIYTELKERGQVRRGAFL